MRLAVLWLCRTAAGEDGLSDADGDALEGPVAVRFQVELAMLTKG
ncbi:hypothetical protein [Streptomyces rhizosphaericus]|nr:hypothetical protein [Streptomyces rhizosphaericus]